MPDVADMPDLPDDLPVSVVFGMLYTIFY